jgi:hypothetical protein
VNPRLIGLTGLLLVLIAALPAGAARAQEAWVINQFDATYVVNRDGTVAVSEDLDVDFGPLQKHGIFRYIPLENVYLQDPDYRRVTELEGLKVDDGQRPIPFTTTHSNGNIEIKIGDPDRLISGQQHYHLTYTLIGALNPSPDTDQLYWNITGNDWEVPIIRASARVTVPSLNGVACFQGPTGSEDPCFSSISGNTVEYRSTQPLNPGSGLTVVTGLSSGSVNVPPLKLVKIKSTEEKVRDFVGLEPIPLALTAFLGVVGPLAIARYWWLAGRDKWYGDVQNLTGSTRQETKPLFTKDTVVTEYQPPELQRRGRRLRPAEIGTLMDERADTLDVTATIVDLAVRGYIRITEMPKSWLFGSKDYMLEKLKEADPNDLLGYESLLFRKLFEDNDAVGSHIEMSDLKNEFYEDLARVKKQLYTQVVSEDRFFAGNPENVRNMHLIGGLVLAGLGGAAVWGLGVTLGAAVIGIPIIITGLLLAASAGFMPRRTAAGREMYRRSLGFREYMVIAETDRQKFNEEINIFQEYLPYAMVYECVDKWAKAFEGLENVPSTNSWYVSTTAFNAAAFSHSMNNFSASMSSAIASTPGGSGGSGFSGGSSGGGGGGGGGGSW